MIRCLSVLFAFLFLTVVNPAMSQEAPESIRIEIDSSPTRVTAYRGRAWIERIIKQDMQPGLYRLVFSDLPSSWQSDSVQAKITGNGKVLGIDTAVRQVSTAPASLEELSKAVENAELSYQAAQDQLLVTDSSIAFVRQMMNKSGNAQGEKTGSTDFDIQAVRAQMEYFSSELKTLYVQRAAEAVKVDEAKRELDIARQRLSNAGGSTRTLREAIVEVAVSKAGPVELTLGYLVRNANWSPRYDVRGDLDAKNVTLEYGAQIVQKTGEDWDDVTLVLSTAQPAQSANPPTINPVYVDVYAPPPPPVARNKRSGSRGAPSAAAGGGGRLGYAADMEVDSMVESAMMDAQVDGGGSSVTFTLPRRVTVKTNSDSAQRTRIADFETDVEFRFVAIPVLTDEVYLRGRFKNTSEFQLLPGQAGIFMGGDYVGPTSLAATSPGSKMEIFFGSDPAMKATRTMLTKNTGETGVFGGWLTTRYQFVLKIDNGSGRAADVELWDRRPISRSEEIEVSVEDLSQPLSTNARYVKNDYPRGLMRWDLSVPAGRTGDDAMTITYDLKIERKEGVQMTPLPD
ncbi:MAG: mucoidy inhibitor MuiA family protein [Phycisphaerales bacterium]|nr:mucoidy inhibitor MuiA family protein [Phycisphaerales bacterium]